ncbi:TetR/AcrR family transcriptional regulator [Companilactobacillus alimentarius]
MDDVFQGFNNWLDIKTMPNGKRRVIKAAVTLFSRQGFDKTSTSQIAQESQMSQATIFKYFRSKKELLLFIIKPMIENILPTTQRILQDNHDGLISWVHFLVNDRYHFLSRNRDAAIILISQVLIDEQVRGMLLDRVSYSKSLFAKKVWENLLISDEIRDDLSMPDFIQLVLGQILFYFLQSQRIEVIDDPRQINRDLQRIERTIILAIRK